MTLFCDGYKSNAYPVSMQRYLSATCFSVLIVTLCSCQSGDKLIVTGHSDRDITEAPLSMELSSPQGSEKLPVLSVSGTQIPSQVDDMNGDGLWDEVSFQMDFSGKESRTVEVNWVDAQDYPSFENRTQIHLGFSPERNDTFQSIDVHERPADHVAQSTPFLYQFEGPGWENDKIAFRSYFDSRNGKDIFGKASSELVLHNVGTGDNYHKLQTWGMDILKVGNSLGAGALAMLRGDSLIRLGETSFASFRKITEGPVRSIFELNYKGWQVGDQSYELTERIEIWAGKNWYKSHIEIKPALEDTLITGIVNLNKAEVQSEIMGEFRVLYTSGDQSENGDYLGMAIAAQKDKFFSINKAPVQGKGITNTELAMLRSTTGTYDFYFMADWEGSRSASYGAEEFKSSVASMAKELSAKIDISKEN